MDRCTAKERAARYMEAIKDEYLLAVLQMMWAYAQK